MEKKKSTGLGRKCCFVPDLASEQETWINVWINLPSFILKWKQSFVSHTSIKPSRNVQLLFCLLHPRARAYTQRRGDWAACNEYCNYKYCRGSLWLCELLMPRRAGRLQPLCRSRSPRLLPPRGLLVAWAVSVHQRASALLRFLSQTRAASFSLSGNHWVGTLTREPKRCSAPFRFPRRKRKALLSSLFLFYFILFEISPHVSYPDAFSFFMFFLCLYVIILLLLSVVIGGEPCSYNFFYLFKKILLSEQIKTTRKWA